MNKEAIRKGIDRVERLALASKWERLKEQPAKYLFAYGFRKGLYPLTRKGTLRCVPTFFGQSMQVLLPAGTDIYLTGGKTHPSEIRLARFMIRELSEGDTFLDAGAHFGYFSLLASEFTGMAGKVIAIEASGSTFDVLRKNCASSSQILCLHRAVSDREEEMNFYEFPVLYSEYNSTDITQFENEGWMKKNPPRKNCVPSVTLDSLAGACSPGNKIFLKIDVEGAEDKVIRGAGVLLKREGVTVIMEYLHGHRKNTSHIQADRHLKEAGYKSFLICSDGSLKRCEEVGQYLKESGVESENVVFRREER